MKAVSTRCTAVVCSFRSLEAIVQTRCIPITCNVEVAQQIAPFCLVVVFLEAVLNVADCFPAALTDSVAAELTSM